MNQITKFCLLTTSDLEQMRCGLTIFAVGTELGHVLHMFLELFLQDLLSDASVMEGLDQTVQFLQV